MPYLILLCLLVTMVSACSEHSENAHSSDSGAVEHSVVTVTVEKQSRDIIYTIPGTVVAKNQLQITPRSTAYIDHIAVYEGDIVEPGMVLVKVDSTQVEASIKGVEASIVYAKAELDDAADDLKRYQVLANSQTLSEDKVRDAAARHAKASAALAQAQAELEAKLQERRYTTLTSPVRAQVRERLFDQGDLAIAGQAILKLDVLASLELEIHVPSPQIGNLRPGQKIEVIAQPDAFHIQGEVIRIVRSADTVTRRSKVRIALPEGEKLSPGQFAQANIVVGKKEFLIIPASAVVERAGIEGVFLTENDMVAKFRSVRTGRAWTDSYEVLAGIDVGQSIIINPPASLRDGDFLRRVVPDGD